MTLVASGINAEDYYYMDTISGYEFDLHREFYYALEPIEESTLIAGDYIGPTTVSVLPDKYAKTARRCQSIGFKFTAKPVVILKKRTFGTFCSLYDTTLGRHTTSHCEECYDSGFKDGYFPSIVVSGIFNAVPKRMTQLDWGSWDPMDAILTLEHYPVVAPDDVVVDRLNRRWKIINIRPVQKALAIITQNCQVRVIPKDDPVYKITIPDLSNYG
jgi:hypothetical protein